MIKLTEMLKKELTEVLGFEAKTDEEFTKAAGEAFATGKLSAERYLELCKDAQTDEANVFDKKLNQIADSLGKLADCLTKQATAEVKEVKTEVVKLDGEKKTEVAGEKAVSNLSRLVTAIGIAVGETKDVEVRVKEAVECYDSSTKAAVYPMMTKAGKQHSMAGRPMMSFTEQGRAIDEPSQRSKAVAGAWAKFLCATAWKGGSRTFGFQSLSDHDKSLIYHALENMEWSGASDGGNEADIKRRRLLPHEQKALIDDSTSGGLEAAPIVFDDQVIMAPLLYGELFPLVTTRPLTRGRRVEGISVGQVAGGWGGVDDTAVTLFNTASYVSAFNTTIYRWEGAIRIGLDFLSDTPIDFGQIVTQQYGEALLNDLDDAIATGNGTTGPEGVMTKSGTTSVAWGGATSIGNYESMLTGIAKAELRPNVMSSVVFGGTQTSYYRAKAIPIGATDNRRLFGEGGMGTQGYQNWSLMGYPFKINTSMANTQVFFAILAKYRMYLREGLTIRTSKEGDTLLRSNELLMVAMARYGGQLERGACATVTSTAPV